MTVSSKTAPAPRSAGQAHFIGLDGLRGVAAFAVLAHHVGLVRNQAGLFSHGYLAVDFFFLLSGFVMGLAYEPRMAEGLSFFSFTRIRLGRLYPMILLGAVLGCAEAVFHSHDFTLAVALAAQLVFVPFAVSRDDAYPLNSVQWSLFFEIFINGVHSAIYERVTTFRLACVVAVSLIALVFTDFHFGSLAVGYDMDNFWGGFARVVFSYSTGLLFYRLFRVGRLRLIRLPYVVVAVSLLMVLAVPMTKWLPDSVVAVLIFPAILFLALGSPPSSGFLKLAAWAGAISYPLYAIHAPLLRMAVLLVPKAAGSFLHALYWAVTVSCILLISWAVEYFYDAPIRRWLRRAASADRNSIGWSGKRSDG